MSNDAKRKRHLEKVARRDAHAKLVAERASDPTYSQRTRTETGYTVSMTPESVDAMRRQEALFVEKFGRKPGPDDPIFFDPTKDEPTALTDASLPSMVTDLVRASEAAGVDPAFAHAFGEVGYLVTEDNRHLFSAHEVEAFSEAVARHQR